MTTPTMPSRFLPVGPLVLFSPVGLRLIDSVTRQAPFGRIRARLEEQEPPTSLAAGLAGASGTLGMAGISAVLGRLAGSWRPSEEKVVISPSGLVSCPALGRRAAPAGKPPRRFRLALEADYYRAGFVKDGADEAPAYPHIEFTVHAYNDAQPLSDAVLQQIRLRDVELLPATNYPFPSQVRVVRGVVEDLFTDARIENALVTSTATVTVRMEPVVKTERVLTDRRGAFCLPLRWAADGEDVFVEATHGQKQGLTWFKFPDELGGSKIIKVQVP